MSVYTDVSRAELARFLQQFNLGELVDFQGVTEGIENTNYRVQTNLEGKEGSYFLTLIEYGPDHPLVDFVTLCSHFEDYGAPVPAAIPDRKGKQLHELKDKPTLIVPCVQGHHLQRHQLSEQHLFNLGKVVGHMHLAAMSFPIQIHNSKGLAWWQKIAATYIESLDEAQQSLLRDEIEYQSEQHCQFSSLPKAVVHGDLFLDNVLFDQDRITGVIDFYNSAYDYLLFDLAVAANDWCIAPDLSLYDHKVLALLEGYQSERALSEEEKQAWPDFLRAAALRFWLSRLDTQAFQQQAGGSFVGKDPDVMANMLIQRRQGL